MISTFDLTKLRGLLQDFYTLTKIRVAVFNEERRELISYPEEMPPFCALLRTDERAARECHACDQRACEYAAAHQSVYTYQCHAGLTETVAPITMSGLVIGYLVFGHVFDYATHREGWEVIRPLCRAYDVDESALKEACWERPVTPKDSVLSAAHLLQAVSSYLCMERMVSLRKEELPLQIDRYLSEHYTEDISTDELCEHFEISRTKLYDIARQNYGCGLATHIRILRIEKAKRLLTEEPDCPIAEIADRCGFEDYNYFIVVFKRLAGMSPLRYRKASLR